MRLTPVQRILDLLADASGTGIAIEGTTIRPPDANFGGDLHVVAQRSFGECLGYNFLSKAVDRCWSISVTPRSTAERIVAID